MGWVPGFLRPGAKLLKRCRDDAIRGREVVKEASYSTSLDVKAVGQVPGL